MPSKIRVWLFLGLLFAAVSSPARAEVDLADLFAKTNPSVVTLTTYNAAGRKLGQGSGFVVDKSGIVATCLHVVADAATVEIQSPDQTIHLATALVRGDKQWDIALLKVKGLGAEPLRLAEPQAVRVGAAVVAIGNPLGVGNTLSQGIISGLRPLPDKSEMIQITAAVSPGSSGGPVLLESSGQVIGVTVSFLSPGQNLNFAVPVRVVQDELKTIGQAPEQKLRDFSPEVKQSIAAARKIRSALEQECIEADAATINNTIEQAIDSGAGIFNAGDHLACFRIYEGAAYKILFILSGRSATATRVLKTALTKADAIPDGDDSASARAWIMRDAFDSILGVHGRKASETPGGK